MVQLTGAVKQASRPTLAAVLLGCGLPSADWMAAALADSLDPMSPYAILQGVPTRILAHSQVEITLGSTMPDNTLSEADYEAWIQQSANVVRDYFGAFPVARLELALIGTGGKGVRYGNAYGERGAALRIFVGEETDERDLLVEDWVLVHEMVHTAVPKLQRSHHWLEEGIATYVESIARLQAGHLSAESVWGGFVQGMPNGLPGPGDRGLDSSGSWGSTYWGGALFCLLADYRIRRRSDNRLGLQQALRSLPRSGVSIEQQWPLERVIAAADEATNTTVFAELYQSMGLTALDVDLDALWKNLGVVVIGAQQVEFDDSAPDAAIRRAIGERPATLANQLH